MDEKPFFALHEGEEKACPARLRGVLRGTRQKTAASQETEKRRLPISKPPLICGSEKRETFSARPRKNVGFASFAARENPFPPRKGRLLVFRLKPRRGKASFVKKTADSFFHSARRRKNHKTPPLGKRRALLFKREERTSALEKLFFRAKKGKKESGKTEKKAWNLKRTRLFYVRRIIKRMTSFSLCSPLPAGS